MSFLPIFDRPNNIGEINCFLRRVVLQNGNSLLTGAESRVTLTNAVLLLPANYFLFLLFKIPLPFLFRFKLLLLLVAECPQRMAKCIKSILNADRSK